MFHFCLSKVYTISLLATLNRRDRLNNRVETMFYDISAALQSEQSQISGLHFMETSNIQQEIPLDCSMKYQADLTQPGDAFQV